MQTYTVEINGVPHTMRLSDEDAKARGLEPVKAKESKAPANKSRTAKAK